MDDYARILAFRVDLLLPVDNSHKGYDSAVITRFIASLKAQIARIFTTAQEYTVNVCYPCKLRYAWVREFGELNGNKHYHMLLLVNREVLRKHDAEYGEFSATSRIAGGNGGGGHGLWRLGVPEIWQIKSPFIYQASLMNLIAEMAQIRTFSAATYTTSVIWRR